MFGSGLHSLPLGSGGVSGKPTDPPVVGFTSLTSAVGRLTPPRIGGGGGISGSLTSAVGRLTPPRIGGGGGVSGRTRDPLVLDRAPLGGSQPTGALVPVVCQAGLLLEPQHWSSQPNSNASLLSPSAVPARPGWRSNSLRLSSLLNPAEGLSELPLCRPPPVPRWGRRRRGSGRRLANPSC